MDTRFHQEMARCYFEEVNDALFVFDPKTSQVVDVNPMAQRLTGFRRKQLLAMPLSEIFSAENEEVQARLKRAIETSDLFHSREGYTLQCKDTPPLKVNLSVTHLHVRPRPLGLIVARDVSERKEAEWVLRESERRFRQLFENSPDAIFVEDLQGTILDVNPAACLLHGFGREDLIGKNAVELAPSHRRDEIAESIKKEADGKIHEIDSYTLAADGRCISVHLISRRIDYGERPALLVHVQDVTERKRSEEAEVHSRMVAEAIAKASLAFIETANVGTMAQIIVEQACRITGSAFGVVIEADAERRARILAVSAMTWDTMQGQSLYDEARREIDAQGFYAMPSGDSLIFKPLQEGLSVLTNDPLHYPDWAGSMPEGHPPIQSFLGVPLKIGDDSVGMIALANRPGGFTEQQLKETETFANTAVLALRMARSEQERIQMEERLRQSQKMEAVGQLAGGVAHDFNNLLLAILGYTELAIERLEPSSGVHEELEQVRTAAEKAASLIRQLLAFSRRQMLEPVNLDLNEVIANLVKMIQRIIGEHIMLDIVPGHRLDTIRADCVQIEQVLMNLCVNARDAMPNGGRIIIETENVLLDEVFCRRHDGSQPGPHVLVSVTDTGSGMDEATRGRIFEPFFSTKEVGKGSGLGLATVYGIVKQHDGYIDVDSERGKGTTFRIFLPAIEKAPELAEDQVTGPGPGGTETILVAEDEAIVRNLAVRILKKAGYTVLCAADGREAIQVFEAHSDRIALVLLDLVMPERSGTEVYERIREIKPDIAVLVSSGYSASSIHAESLLKEGLQMISKPYAPRALLRTIRDLLDGT